MKEYFDKNAAIEGFLLGFIIPFLLYSAASFAFWELPEFGIVGVFRLCLGCAVVIALYLGMLQENIFLK
jgi:biotin transporter BioY